MAGDKAFGAITIYAKEPEAFSEEEVQLLSELTEDVVFGIVTLRIRAAHAEAVVSLERNEERYRTLFEGMTEGFALHEIIVDDDGAPCDYRFIEINPAFEQLTGLKAVDIVGRTFRETMPGESAEWVKVYGQVALTGEPVHYENYSTTLKRWYEVYSYRPAPGQFATIFMDVTARKQAEADIRRHIEELKAANEELARFNRVAVDRELRMVELKKRVNELCLQAGQPAPYPLDFDKDA
jgi:PAS domain S-box-containing protein